MTRGTSSKRLQELYENKERKWKTKKPRVVENSPRREKMHISDFSSLLPVRWTRKCIQCGLHGLYRASLYQPCDYTTMKSCTREGARIVPLAYLPLVFASENPHSFLLKLSTKKPRNVDISISSRRSIAGGTLSRAWTVARRRTYTWRVLTSSISESFFSISLLLSRFSDIILKSRRRSSLCFPFYQLSLRWRRGQGGMLHAFARPPRLRFDSTLLVLCYHCRCSLSSRSTTAFSIWVRGAVRLALLSFALTTL